MGSQHPSTPPNRSGVTVCARVGIAWERGGEERTLWSAGGPRDTTPPRRPLRETGTPQRRRRRKGRRGRARTREPLERLNRRLNTTQDSADRTRFHSCPWTWTEGSTLCRPRPPALRRNRGRLEPQGGEAAVRGRKDGPKGKRLPSIRSQPTVSLRSGSGRGAKGGTGIARVTWT